MKKIIYLFILLVGFSCNDNDGNGQIEDMAILLGNSQISVQHLGSNYVVKVKSKGDWNILESSVPQWCEIGVKKSNEFAITILPNRTFTSRKGEIIIKNIANSVALQIFQEGVNKNTKLEWHTFPVNSVSKVSNSGQEYRIKANEIFITPTIRNTIFHGNLIEKTLKRGTQIKQDKKYTFTPITIFGGVGSDLYSREAIIPSINETNSLFNAILGKYPTQNTQFTSLPPIQFNSYKELHLLGVGNLGLKLDEILTGNSYTKKEMGNRIGLIYSYCNVLFETSMDYPDQLVNDTISEDMSNKLAYVNAIKYGKQAFLIVETDYEYDLSKAVVGKIMNGKKLNNEEEQIKNSFTVNYLFFNKDSSINIVKGHHTIQQYVSDIAKQPIVPLSFSINNYKDNSAGNLEVVFNLP